MTLFMTTKSKNLLRVKSFTREAWYEVDLDYKTCGCPAFKKKHWCKHLGALGLYVSKPFFPKDNPTFSQALCGLVKALRIRRIDEVVYWMLYMDTSTEVQYRFRVARRLLIGTAEDGHSIPVMEKCANNFLKLVKRETPLLYLVAEAIRICKLPNWWHSDSGGQDYIYQSLVGQRQWWYKKWDHKLKTLEKEMEAAVEAQDKAMALGGVMAYAALQKSEQVGATKQAEFLYGLAEKVEHELAMRLCKVHLSQKSALSGDNNFLCMAAWMMAGGKSPVAEKIEPVTAGECYEAIKKAQESWTKPHPIPTWACDGQHCAGNDTRFMGMFPEMIAVVNAFKYYGRIDPADKWLPEFQCWDGLQVEKI